MAYPDGMFSWADVALPDPQAGKGFYTGLFGWESEDSHFEDGSFMYSMFSQGGKAVAGLGQLPKELQDSGAPAMWNSYVNVDDLDATIERWTAAGGSVLMPAMDITTAGRMAFVASPEGAAVGLWQAGDHVGAELFKGHGAMTWNELATRDSAAARDFLGKVFSWEFEQMPGPNEYWVIKLDTKTEDGPYMPDKFNGGILTMGETFPDGIPPYWGVYFTVDDADAIASRAEELGGKTLMPGFDTDVGRIAVVADPQGAAFSIIKPVPAPQ